MSRKKAEKILFFSKTLDFLEHYLPEQSLKSRNTIETYRDIVNIGLHFILKNVRPYAASCSEA